MTEDKLCLFLEQEVVNHESRAPGYQGRKERRKEMWKEGERAKKRLKGEVDEGWVVINKEDEEEWDEEALEA